MLNVEMREQLKNGGHITFMYDYVPSERAWHTMYQYVIYRYSDSGDFTFYCERNSYEPKYSGSLCSCLYSEQVWEDLLSLVLDQEQLRDITSVYDANGMVTSNKIPKAISIGGYGVYAPKNIDSIEAYFKKLAMNTGVLESDLDWNVRIDDENVADKTMITNLHGDFLINYLGGMSEDESKKLENYLRSKYEETGVRMYVIVLNFDDNDQLHEMEQDVLKRATSPGIAFGLTASLKHCSVTWHIKDDKEALFQENNKEIADTFFELKKGSLYEKLIKAVDKAYELYDCDVKAD